VRCRVCTWHAERASRPAAHQAASAHQRAHPTHSLLYFEQQGEYAGGNPEGEHYLLQPERPEAQTADVPIAEVAEVGRGSSPRGEAVVCVIGRPLGSAPGVDESGFALHPHAAMNLAGMLAAAAHARGVSWPAAGSSKLVEVPDLPLISPLPILASTYRVAPAQVRDARGLVMPGGLLAVLGCPPRSTWEVGFVLSAVAGMSLAVELAVAARAFQVAWPDLQREAGPDAEALAALRTALGEPPEAPESPAVPVEPEAAVRRQLRLLGEEAGRQRALLLKTRGELRWMRREIDKLLARLDAELGPDDQSNVR
jgi:hypothetical protein